LQGYPRCLRCYPWDNVQSTSKSESELYTWIRELKTEAIQGKRFFSDKEYELDIFIPSLKLVIEFDGLWWHSELSGKARRYHVEKTGWFEKNFGIRVIHVFESEWVTKRAIVESVISNMIRPNPVRIPARKCEIRAMEAHEAERFFEANHLGGHAIGGKSFALVFRGEIVMGITVGKSRFARTDGAELYRMCPKIGHTIIGGFSKLLKHQPYNRVLSYCDRRYFTGKGYEAVGFTVLGVTPPNYWYFRSNSYDLRSRVEFQKHKLPELLEHYDRSISEWANMQVNGWNRIWDCGSIKMEYVK
jgi:very-short-patch-repair endonuclease